ncbi:MAG: hypothetical protein LBP59_07265 [Planctomycetaceae bacterium]|nr:hypothetical protein [Planctomycetaceae bacterium]
MVGVVIYTTCIINKLQAQTTNNTTKTNTTNNVFPIPHEPQDQNSNQTETATNKSDTKSEQLFLEGANYERRGDVTAAMKLYNAGLEVAQGSTLRFMILHRMAVLSAKVKNYTESERYFRMALTDGNVNPTFLCDFAKLYIDRNRLDDAETILKNAVLVAPKDRRTLFNLGQIIAQQNDRQSEGLRYLKLALGDKLAYKELAKIYRKLGSENQAQFAEQQALLANDETPQLDAAGKNEVSPALIEKIKHELILLESKEIASVQDKILTEDERQLLTNPKLINPTTADKSQNTNQTIKQIPTTSDATPEQNTLSQQTPQTTTTLIPPLASRQTTTTTTTSNLSADEQKNTPQIPKRIPDISNEIEPVNESVDKQKTELRPIDFDPVNNVTKNTPSISFPQVKLIPYQKIPVDIISDANIASLTNPSDNSAHNVSLSFDPESLRLNEDRNKTTIIINQKIEGKPSIKIRELENQNLNRQYQYKITNNIQTNQPNKNEKQKNNIITENQYAKKINTTQHNYRTNNVANNMLKYPQQSDNNNFYHDSNVNDFLPKLEFVENKKNIKPKSKDEPFLAFRLASDTQQRQQQTLTTPNLNATTTPSPFPENSTPNTKTKTKTNESHPTLVIHPIDLKNKQQKQTDATPQNKKFQNEIPDDVFDQTTNNNQQNQFIVTKNPLADISVNVKDNEKIAPPNDAETTTKTKDETESKTETESKSETKTEKESKVESKVESKTEPKIESDSKSDIEIDVSKDIDLSMRRLPVGLRNRFMDNVDNVAQVTPKNDTTAIPIVVDVVNDAIKLPYEKTTHASQDVVKQKTENITNLIEQLPVEIDGDLHISDVVDVAKGVGNVGNKLPNELLTVETDTGDMQYKRNDINQIKELKVDVKLEAENLQNQNKSIADNYLERQNLSEEKSYPLWTSPNITTQKNEDWVNSKTKILSKNSLSNNNNNSNDKFIIESKNNKRENFVTEFKPDIDESVSDIVGLADDVLESSDVMREPKRVDNADKMTSNIPKHLNVPKRLPVMPKNEQSINNNWESYSDIKFDNLMQKKISSIDGEVSARIFENDVGVSSTKIFRQKQNNPNQNNPKRK